MSLLTKPLGGRGTIFTFEKTGDVLLMHRHGAADAHYMIVARGRVHVRTPLGESAIYDAGTIIDPGPEHEVMALEDNSRIVNVTK
jgi:hypothetical protein